MRAHGGGYAFKLFPHTPGSRPGNKFVLARDARDKFTTKNFDADVNPPGRTLERF
jgi:hypothetical protein